MSNVVYVLGAGFSMEGGAPSQKEILPYLFSLQFNPPHEIEEHRLAVRNFLEDTFRVDCESQEALNRFQLEDLFTVLDRCIINQEAFNFYSEETVKQLRKSLGICINSVIATRLELLNTPFYNDLANAILKRRVDEGQENDPFAFIILNWDIILDNAIYRNYRQSTMPEIRECRIDYCCYSTPIDMPDHNHHSLEVKAQGFYNIKLQKLHGSMNWLRCSNCGVLYYKMEEKIVMWEITDERRCLCGNGENILKSVLIEPTFIKDLNNTHIKMVWHNALLDLMEADKIVFIGYSLPVADFEFRYLLKKGIEKGAEIKIVLTEADRNSQAVENYKSFFGSQLIDSFNFEGSSAFLRKEFRF